MSRNNFHGNWKGQAGGLAAQPVSEWHEINIRFKREIQNSLEKDLKKFIFSKIFLQFSKNLMIFFKSVCF